MKRWGFEMMWEPIALTIFIFQTLAIRYLLRSLQESMEENEILLKRIHAFQATVDELTKKDGP